MCVAMQENYAVCIYQSATEEMVNTKRRQNAERSRRRRMRKYIFSLATVCVEPVFNCMHRIRGDSFTCLDSERKNCSCKRNVRMRHIKVDNEKFGANHFYLLILFLFRFCFFVGLFTICLKIKAKKSNAKPRCLNAFLYARNIQNNTM